MAIAFLSIFVAGLALAMISWIFGELFEFGGDAADAVGELAMDVTPDFPGGEVASGVDLSGGVAVDTPSPVSSRVIFAGLTAFGGFGFIGEALGWPALGSISFALAGFVLASAGMFFGVVVPIAKQQGSLYVDRARYVGLEAQVATTIPAEGVGQVTFPEPNSGAIVTEAASSADGAPIAAGSAVRVVRVAAGSLIVSRQQ